MAVKRRALFFGGHFPHFKYRRRNTVFIRPFKYRRRNTVFICPSNPSHLLPSPRPWKVPSALLLTGAPPKTANVFRPRPPSLRCRTRQACLCRWEVSLCDRKSSPGGHSRDHHSPARPRLMSDGCWWCRHRGAETVAEADRWGHLRDRQTNDKIQIESRKSAHLSWKRPFRSLSVCSLYSAYSFLTSLSLAYILDSDISSFHSPYSLYSLVYRPPITF